ncbi:MAG: CDP-glucose 4,6-dehydratase [Butyrivibrio sp.]|nr:CDP-glucose 4,6-dehydratase [Butyrivibrio sp.]
MLDFYKGKRVLVTGHTGFKGSWLCRILALSGAVVYGYALEPEEGNRVLFYTVKDSPGLTSHIGDIRDYQELKSFFDMAQPQIVFHLAAQPIVRTSYKEPRLTYETNVMGTVNLCECIRLGGSVKSFVNVTTDKVYLNPEDGRSFSEEDKLDGFDPYSNSKSCSELVTHSYCNSFLKDMNIAVSTARAGNVIGGGDFAADRLAPDLMRAALSGSEMIIRNPDSVRPFQHVLEALSAYLLLAKRQYEDMSFAGAYNVGPLYEDCKCAGEIALSFADKWNEISGKELDLSVKKDGGPHEAGLLYLDCKKIRERLGWEPKWDIDTALLKCALWTLEYQKGSHKECMDRQIKEYFEEV